MRRLTLLLLPLIAACSTPDGLRQDGVQSTYTLRQAPAQAARCMERNASEYLSWFEGRASERDGGAFEVVVRSGGNPIAVADVRANGSGSTATIRRAGGLVFQADLPAAMAKGC